MAITRDNISIGAWGASPLTFSHTIGSGSNRILLVFIWKNVTTDLINTVTYNGVAMTAVNAGVSDGTTDFVKMYYLLNPPTGANNVVVTVSSGNVTAYAVSYFGVNQAAPEANGTNFANPGTSLSDVLTTIASGAWMVAGFGSDAANTFSAGAGTSIYGQSTANNMAIADSNGPLSPGSNSLNVTCSSQRIQSVFVSLAPAAPVTTTLSETVSLTDTIKRATSRLFSEAPTIADVLTKVRIKFATLLEKAYVGNGSYGLSFDGVTQQGTIGSLSVSGQNATVSFLVKNPGPSQSPHYVLRSSANSRTYVTSASSNLLNHSKGNPQTTIKNGITLVPNSWNLVVLQWRNNAGQMQGRVVVNDVDQNAGSWVNFSDSTDGNFFNIYHFSSSQRATGSMAELRFWNRLVSDSDLTDLYNRVRVPDLPDGEWLMSEGGGTNIYDTSANAKNGVLVSPTWIDGPVSLRGVAKATARALADSSTLTDTFAKAGGWFRTFTEAPIITDSIAKAVNHVRTFVESFSLVDYIKKLLNGLDSRYSKKYPSNPGTYSSKYESRPASYEKKYP